MSDHPDREALSASLDGEEGTAAHVAGCADCQAQVAQLRSVKEAVGGPVRPPAPGMIDAAVARALEEAAAWETAPAAPAAPTAPTATSPAPAPAWPPARPGRPRPEPAREGRWRLWMTGSAAAAVLAVVVVVTALMSSGGSRTGDDTALSAGPPAQESAPGPGIGAPGAATAVGGGESLSLPVQELGDVNDVTALRQRVAGAIATRPLAATTDAAAAPRAVGTRVCEIEARTARPQLGVVVYVANVRFGGTAGVALGFADVPGATPVTLLVLASAEGCRVLAETTIP